MEIDGQSGELKTFMLAYSNAHNDLEEIYILYIKAFLQKYLNCLH